MSSELTVSLIVPPAAVAEQFAFLVKRLESRGTIGYCSVEQPRAEPSYSRIPVEEARHVEFLREVASSDRQLHIEVKFPLKIGRRITLFLELNGRDFRQGVPAAREGPISVWFGQLNVLPYTYKQDKWEKLHNLPKESQERYILQQSPDYALSPDAAALRDTADLFLTIVGDGTSDIQNVPRLSAAMFGEYSWRIPVECYMVFHTDIRDFFRDLSRTFAAYH